MEREPLRVVIIGHVDHGKSTLIGKLMMESGFAPEYPDRTGAGISEAMVFDPAFLVDQFEEERSQKRTIDTTQTGLRSAGNKFVLIDAPGHKEFVTAMITGASEADTAVLVVDATKGLEDQTKRHSYIIALLGIRNIVVAVNKMDLCGYDKRAFYAVEKRLSVFLKKIKINPVYVIPVSAKEGTNLAGNVAGPSWYKGPCLLRALKSIAARKKPRRLPLRFCVQDKLILNGKTALLGKVVSGILKKDRSVISSPAKSLIQIRNILVFGEKRDKAVAGENIALTVPDVSAVSRGSILSASRKKIKTRRIIRARIYWMSDQPLRLKERFRLRIMFQSADCEALKIENRVDPKNPEKILKRPELLRKNESARVTFKTARPVAAERYDFIAELGRLVIERGDIARGAGIID